MNRQFHDAPHLLVSPIDMYWIKSGTEKALSGCSFVPVCQYPIGYSVEDGEQGFLGKILKNGDISSVERRVFCTK